MMQAFTTERVLFDDTRRLGRNVGHDSRSRRYPFRASRPNADLISVRHHSNIGVLDQQEQGACTGFAALACLGMGMYFASLAEHLRGQWHAGTARALYELATTLDGVPGTAPPEDPGSDGLGVAKACQEWNLIAGYRHCFSADDVLHALQDGPVITGTAWYASMWETDEQGIVTLDRSAGLDGGHEYCLDEVDLERGLVGFTNSWGSSWGVGGRGYLTLADYRSLLAERGDATVFVPIGLDAPQPEPVEDPEDPDLLRLAARTRSWAERALPWFGAGEAQNALRQFLRAKGL